MFTNAITYLLWMRALSLRHVSILLIFIATLFGVLTSTPLVNISWAETTPVATISTAKSAVSSTSTTKAAQATAQPAQTPTLTPVEMVTTPVPIYDTVSIPSLGFSSQLVTVGVTPENAVDVHPNLVGWYSGSAQIGNSGAAFLDGHNPGIFSNLPNIDVGAKISIKKNGAIYDYKVVYRETVLLANVDMNEVLSVYGNASEGVNLMTCIGPYNPATGTTDERLIVYAVRS